MEQQGSGWFVCVENDKDATAKQKTHLKATRSFVSALKMKYCTNHEIKTPGIVLVFHGRPKTTDEAELGYLRNVVLSDCRIGRSGLDHVSMRAFCPNVVDLDISGNHLDTWSEILPIITELDNLKFLNLARNKISNTQGELQQWTGTLPAIENLVLNMTEIQWSDVISLCRMLRHLKELHICGNGYRELPEKGCIDLGKVECLRLNNNRIESWKEIWKLRHLSSLKSMILSGNPLLDVFFIDNDDLDLDPQCDCCCHDDNNGNSDITDDNIDKDCQIILQYLIEKVSTHETADLENPGPEEGKTNDFDDGYRNQNTHSNKSTLLYEIFSNCNEKTGLEKEQSNCNRRSDVEYTNMVLKSADNIRNTENDRQVQDSVDNTNHDIVDVIYDTDMIKNEGSPAEAVEAWYEQIVSDVVHNLEIKASRPLCNNNFENSSNHLKCNERNDNSFKKEHTGKYQSYDSQMKLELGDLEELPKGENSEVTCTCYCGRDEPVRKPFNTLETLCVSETKIGKWKHLSSLSSFPSLKTLRIKDIKLGCKLNQEDRRKLFLASLPNIKILNGSEVTLTERDKSERHLVRYFMDKNKKPSIYHSLEKKHGTLSPLVDIDISRGYKEWVTLTFVFQGEVVLTQKVCVREPVGRLRLIIAEKLCLYASMKNIQLYHKYCSPCHQDNGEDGPQFEQLILDTLPMSRFDIMDGDEIHIDVCDSFKKGSMNYLYVRNYLPKFSTDMP